MSATICAWMRHTAIISGRIVNQPTGPSGTAKAPAVSEALPAAVVIAARDSASASLLLRRVLGGTSPMESRIDWPMLAAVAMGDALVCFFVAAIPDPLLTAYLRAPTMNNGRG